MSQELAAQVGQRVRAFRDELGLSAQQVSDRTAQHGHTVTRSSIANLENGRRPTITVPELLALARALDTEPWMLCAELGPAIQTKEVGALRARVQAVEHLAKELDRLAKVCDRQTEEILRLRAHAS